MKLKALCNVYYGGTIHKAGEVFESDKKLSNTIVVEENKPAENKTPAENPENGTPEESKPEGKGTESNGKKR